MKYGVWGVIAAAAGVLVLVAGCAGAYGSKTDLVSRCRADLNEVVLGPDVCDPILIEQFEVTVSNWHQRCSNYTQHGEKKELERKLMVSRACAEREQRKMVARAACTEKLNLLAGQQSCAADACQEAARQTQKLSTECRELDLEPSFFARADELTAVFEERIADGVLTAEFENLRNTCLRADMQSDALPARGVLGEVLGQVEGKNVLTPVPPSKPEVWKAQQGALAICRRVVAEAVQTMVSSSADELKSRRMAKQPEQWLTQLGNLEDTLAHLKQPKLAGAFPQAASAIRQTLDEFEPTKIKQEKAALKQKRARARGLMNRWEKRCRDIHRKSEIFESKIDQYEKKGVDWKTRAYQTKLDESREQLSKLKTEIEIKLQLSEFPDDSISRINEKMSKAGCEISAP